MADVNPEARAVDEKVDRLICREPAEPDLTELLQPSTQRGMIGDGDVHFQHAGQGTQEAFGLPERKVEDYVDRECCLDGDVRVGALTASGTSSVVTPDRGRVTTIMWRSPLPCTNADQSGVGPPGD